MLSTEDIVLVHFMKCWNWLEYICCCTLYKCTFFISYHIVKKIDNTNSNAFFCYFHFFCFFENGNDEQIWIWKLSYFDVLLASKLQISCLNLLFCSLPTLKKYWHTAVSHSNISMSCTGNYFCSEFVGKDARVHWGQERCYIRWNFQFSKPI